MDRLWTRSFVLTSLGSLLLFSSFYLLLPTMPLFVKELGGLEAHVGLATGVFTIAAVAFRPVAGGLLDRYGRRPFLLAGVALFALCMYAYGWIGAVGALLFMRFVHGVGWAFATTAAASAAADIVPPARRGEGMGWYGLAQTLAMAAGPMLATWTLAEGSFRTVFLLATGLAVVALLSVSIPRYPFRPPAELRRVEVLDPATLPVAVSVALMSFAYGALTTFLPLFAVTLDVNPGTFFLVYALALTAARPLGGTVSDRRGETAVVVPAAGLIILALLVLSGATGLGGVLMAAVLYGVGFGSAHPALQAALLRMVPRERFGVANASFFTAFDLGIALGSTLLGWAAGSLGYRGLFTVAAAAVALSLAAFLALVRPRLACNGELVRG
ncbi:MAG TPA: MFS transporter [Limnochordales bacterium]|nr:MFS transporter [Limnochordales bacterium]